MNFIIGLINTFPSAIAQGLLWGIMAIGIYITYKILDIADLTVDGSLCTGGAISIILLINGYPMWLAIMSSIIAGILAGYITGILITKLKIPAILSGILTQLALYSINLHIMGFGTPNFSKSNLPISVDKYNLLISSRYVRDLSLKNPIIITVLFVIMVIFILYWFFGTELGCAIRATGANQFMARSQGINTDKTKVIGLIISNALVALSGALLAQFQGFSDINMGRGAIVIGLAAVIIGEQLFSKIFKNFGLKLFGCVLGAIIYYLVIQFVVRLGLSTDDLKLLTSLVVAIFLAIPNLKNNKWKGIKNVKS